jgi:hypothetical protein
MQQEAGPVPVRQDVLGDPRFWAGVHCAALGQINPHEPDTAAYCNALGVSESDAAAWFDAFTGPFIDARDGQSDDPAIVSLPLTGSIQAGVELHPGDMYWWLREANGASVKLANVGPHWQLPGLRWAEVEEIARAAPGRNAEVLLLLLPTVWLTDDEDHAAVRHAVRAAWGASGLVGAGSAIKLSEKWASAVAGGREYPWRQGPGGEWVSTAEWSSRSVRRPERERATINRLVAGARATA